MLFVWEVSISSQAIRSTLTRRVVAENMPAAIATAVPLVRGSTEDDVVQVKRGEQIHGVAA